MKECKRCFFSKPHKAFLKMDSLIENARRMREQLMEMTVAEAEEEV